MKKIRFTARFTATRTATCRGAAPIGAPEPSGPGDRYRQQGELNVNEIAQEYGRVQLGRCDVDTAIGGRERTTGIDRIRDQGRRDPDQESDAERCPPAGKSPCCATRQRQVAIGVIPSSTSAIRSRVPRVVSAGS